MNKSAKKLILYGAGKIGKKMALQFTCEKVQIECFCDSDPNKWGKNYSGYAIKSVDEIKHLYPEGSYHILFTMLKKSAENVKKELIEKNVFSINDFYDEEIDPLEIMDFFTDKSNSFYMIPRELERNFLQLDEKNENELIKGLLFHGFHVGSYEDLPSDYARKDFSNHL